MSMSRGIDVSHHQGLIAWPAIKAELGISWAACKATEGLTFVDSEFARNWAGMKAAGLVRVAYHFARPGSDATAQARKFLSVVKPVKGDVLCLDLEQSDGRSQDEVNAWAKEFANILRREAVGITTVAYLGGYSANGSGRGLSLYFDYWWYPRYATMSPVTTWPATYAPRLSGNTTGWDAPHIWQWAASLITRQGAVDANVSILSATALRDGRPNPTPAPDVAPTPAPAPTADTTEAPMIVIRAEKGWWYLLLAGKLIGLYQGQKIDPRLPRLTVTEAQWARFLKAKVEVVL